VGSIVRLTTISDRVGVGTVNPLSKLSVGADGESECAIYGEAPNTSGIGVKGYASYGLTTKNYGGYFAAGGSSGIGVYGVTYSDYQASHYGGYFEAFTEDGDGLYGVAHGYDGRGVNGASLFEGVGFQNWGGNFWSMASNGIGVRGIALSNANIENIGGYFEAGGFLGKGVFGYASNADDCENTGGLFVAKGMEGRGVYGNATGMWGYGVYGTATNSGQVSNYGGYFVASGVNGRGVYGSAPLTGYAGYFHGNVYATGTLNAGSKLFKIDHPLDPANKFLNHSSVESSEMMNIYNGNIVTDENGNANIQLPDWFEALNKDFRYQLTVIGEFAQAIVNEEINSNKFSIKTNKPNIKVSWQVTGIRHDAYANENMLVVEEEKLDKDRGKYLHPTSFNLPLTAGIDYNEKIEKDRIQLDERLRNEETLRIEERREMIEELKVNRKQIIKTQDSKSTKDVE
jgi:hypothetical protein